jgi:hypothetical protein
MAVNGPSNIPERIRAVPPIQAEPRVRKTAAPAPPPRDQVTISSQAREVRSLSRQAETTPEIRPERVAQVKAQAPKAPAAKIAEKLLTEN